MKIITLLLFFCVIVVTQSIFENLTQKKLIKQPMSKKNIEFLKKPQDQCISVPLRRQGKKMKQKIETFNMLKHHQAKALGKEEFDQISFDEQINFLKESQKVEESDSKAQNINLTLKKVKTKVQEEDKKENAYEIHAPLFVKKNSFTEQQKLIQEKMKNHRNTFFTGELGVGDSKSSYNLIFDTGSSLCFINSKYCTDTGCVKGNQYDSKASSTYEDLEYEVEVQFGSGALTGYLGKDTFFVNGVEIPETTFIEITKEDGDVFQDGDFDGLVGLSFPDEADDLPTLYDDMWRAGTLTEQKFAFFLDREEKDSKSMITFGGVDDSKFTGDLNYHDVVNKDYWSLAAEQLLIDGTDSGICTKDAPCKLVIDSGTSLFTGPTDALGTLFTKMNADEGCKNLVDMPKLTFVADGINYELDPEEYILTVTKNGVQDPHEHADMEDVEQCVGAFYALDIDAPEGPLWVMGDIFMSKYYSVFDRENNKIGLALAK